MQIYNFSLCKEVKDNHLNVVLLRQTEQTLSATPSPPCVHVQYNNFSPSLGPSSDLQQQTYMYTSRERLSRTSIQEAFIVSTDASPLIHEQQRLGNVF